VAPLNSYAHITLGFRPTVSGTMVPTYPLGLSLLIVAVSSVFGWTIGPPLTLWLHVVGGGVLLYAFARRLSFSVAASALAAVLLAACPVYLFVGLEALSDVPAVVWTMAAVYCAWLSRERPAWAVASGACVALAVLVRPTDVLVLVPVALCLGPDFRRWVRLVLGGLPGAIFLGLVNQALYGKIVTTGYGDVSDSFSTSNVAPTLAHYAHWIPLMLTPGIILVVGLPVVFRGALRPITLVLATWLAVFLGFYAFYVCTAETWWALRFVLPAFPALILGALVVGRWMGERLGQRTKQVLVGALLVAAIGWQAFWCDRQAALQAASGERAYLDAVQWAQRNVPARALVVCMQTSGALLYYTDFPLLRYDVPGIRENLGAIERACAAGGHPIYAMLFEFERVAALERAMPGTWTQVGATRDVTVWRRDGPTPVPVPTEPWRELVTVDELDGRPTLQTGPGWYGIEQKRDHRWSWCRGTGALQVQVESPLAKRVRVTCEIRSLDERKVTISSGGFPVWRGIVTKERREIVVVAPLRDGKARLDFTTDRPVPPASAADKRPLAFAIYDPELALSYTDQ
jgi:hypothetical protein